MVGGIAATPNARACAEAESHHISNVGAGETWAGLSCSLRDSRFTRRNVIALGEGA